MGSHSLGLHVWSDQLHIDQLCSKYYSTVIVTFFANTVCSDCWQVLLAGQCKSESSQPPEEEIPRFYNWKGWMGAFGLVHKVLQVCISPFATSWYRILPIWFTGDMRYTGSILIGVYPHCLEINSHPRMSSRQLGDIFEDLQVCASEAWYWERVEEAL